MRVSAIAQSYLSTLTARHGRLRVHVFISWLFLVILISATSIAWIEFDVRPSIHELTLSHDARVEDYIKHAAWVFLFAHCFWAGVVYAVLHYGLVVPIESFRRDTKSESGDRDEQSAQEINSLSRDVRRRTDQLRAALESNEMLRKQVVAIELRSQRNGATIQTFVNNISDLIAFVDCDGRVKEASPTLCRLLQLHRSAVIDQQFNDVFKLFDCFRDNPNEYPVNYLIDDLLKQRSSVPKLTELLLIDVHRTEHRITLRCVCTLSADGTPLGVVVCVTDHAGAKEQPKSSMAVLTSADQVSGLQSETLFDLRMREIVDIARSQKTPHALLLCSPDNLAEVIESHGIRAGNEVLWRTARLLEEHVPDNMELFRVGLDVFGIICPFSELSAQGDLADRICLASAARPFIWGELQHECTLSIGGIQVDSLSEGVEPLLHDAHRALISARHAGGGQVCLEVPDELLGRRRRQDNDWVNWLLPRLEGGLAHLSSQVILPISRDTHRLPMCEVFVRIEDDDGVWVTPDFFMPALERRQLSHKLDLWVIERTLAEMAGKKSLVEDYECVSINLSGWSLSNPSFGEQVYSVISKYDVPPKKLCFEITEQQVSSHLSETMRFIEMVKPMGVRFSLDRYRAMGGLHGLKDAPLDFVKIHPSLTSSLKNEAADPVEALHLTWMNKVCLARGIVTIALGIEHEHAVSTLKSLDIQYAQGVVLNKIGPIVT